MWREGGLCRSVAWPVNSPAQTPHACHATLWITKLRKPSAPGDPSAASTRSAVL